MWRENVETWGIFIACCSKWDMGAMGGFIGLNDTRLTNVLRYKKVKDKATVFDDLLVMEIAARSVLNAKCDD